MNETTSEHIIDCDDKPFIPYGWSIEEHRKGGLFTWNAVNVLLYLHKIQKKGKWIDGHKLLKVLAEKLVLNANVLDYLLEHPHLIPEDWKGKNIFFWGTIYRDKYDILYVRYLYWCVDGWYWDSRWLGNGWSGRHFAAVLAS